MDYNTKSFFGKMEVFIMKLKDLDEFEGEQLKKEIIEFVDGLPNEEVIKYYEVMRNYKKLYDLLHILRSFK